MNINHFFRYGFSVLCLVIVILFNGLPFALAGTSPSPFKWIDDEDYSPFIHKDSLGNPSGFYKDLMNEIFKRMGIPLQCEVYPWKRAQKYVQEGLGDGMVTTMTQKRRSLFKATDPLFINNERVFARSDNPRIKQIMAIKSIEGLKPFKVVETIGSGWSEEHFKDLNIIWAPTHTTALNMLANGRADIYVLGREPGISDIIERINKKSPYREGFKKIMVGQHTLTTINYCLLIRKNSNYIGIIPEFNRTLHNLKEDGTYQSFLRKYFPPNLPGITK